MGNNTHTTPPPIGNDNDNDRVVTILEEIDAITEPTPEQIATAKTLTTLVQNYETRYSLDKVTGAGILHELMLANDIKLKDLESFASSEQLQDILDGKRKINVNLARKLGKRFNVSYNLFL